LTGSGSLGKTKRYFYYHCKCGFRIRADKVHQSFLETINVLKPSPEYVHLFRIILEKLYKESTFLESVNQRHTIKRMEELHDNIYSARSLLLSKDIDAGEYHKIISDCETKITFLKNKLDASLISLAQFKNRVKFMYPMISELQRVFEKADVSEKRQMFNLLFQKNIEWSDSCFYKCLNNQITHIYNLGNKVITGSPVTDSFDNISTESLSEEHRRILNIEKNKGREINALQAQRILSFIYDYARFIIQLYTEKPYQH